MLRTVLIASLAATACAQEPHKPTALGDAFAPVEVAEDPRLEHHVDLPMGAPHLEVAPRGPVLGGSADELLHAQLASWSGMGLEDASACTSEGCVAASGAFASVELPEGEVTVRVVAKGTVERHVQVVAGGSAYIAVPTEEEADGIAAFFGVERMPGAGTLIQLVESAWPVHPELSVDADGPYFLDGRGWPLADDEVAERSYYVFFNVPPGLHSVDLPGCDDGEQFWGTPHDESIDLEMAPNAWLGLAPIDCIH